MRILALLGVFSLAACSGDSTPTIDTPDEYVIDCDSLPPDAGSGTFASDENWNAFVNAEAASKVQMDAAKSPVLTAPAGGATLSASTPPTFTFKPTPTTARAPARGCHPRGRSLLARLATLIEGTAEAHCGAFTGENYVLRVSAAGASHPLYLAVLSVTSFTPEDAIWKQKMSGRAGQTVSVTVERGVFFRGDLSEGPYLQGASTFPVGP